MPFSDEEISEFKIEAEELLDSAERSLSALAKGEAFSAHYDAIFRVFHSLKGAAGMMELTKVQAHMHLVETAFVEEKGKPALSADLIHFFLRAVDACRELLEGKSIQFTYKLEAAPAAKPTAIAAAPAAAPKPVKPAASKLGKVLMVDDEPALVELLRDLLADSGFDVQGTTDPEEAIRLCESYRPDVVLSDISMPNITGQELLRRIKKNHPDLPVIFLSGHVDKDALLEGIRNGVYSVIEKPFNRVQVVDACTNAARLHHVSKLFQRSVNLVLYQFSDLDDFLMEQGKEDVRNSIRYELDGLLKKMKELRNYGLGGKVGM